MTVGAVLKQKESRLRSSEQSELQEINFFHEMISLLWFVPESHVLVLILVSLVPENVILG